jgi:isoquinoline 1-oxidoreductase beta subunit
MPDGTARVPETHVAIDCGFTVNPERVTSQVEGACVFGMTTASMAASPSRTAR